LPRQPLGLWPTPDARALRACEARGQQLFWASVWRGSAEGRWQKPSLQWVNGALPPWPRCSQMSHAAMQQKG